MQTKALVLSCLLVAVTFSFAGVGCDDGSDGDADTDVDGDGDSDTDTDTDTDSDVDGDSDTDTDGDSDGDGDADGDGDGDADVEVECTDDGECDDDDGCTEDTCDDDGVCHHDLIDGDGDGHVSEACGGDDCDDTSEDVHPGADELCNGIDDDCDEALSEEEDADRDGYATPDCGGDDCDDTSESVHPGAEELCNGIDDNCDDACDEDFECCLGATRDCTTTCDTEGVDVCTDACAWECTPPPEDVCNAGDDDCDDATDEVDTVLVTTAEGDSIAPSLAWNGAELGLVWYDARDPAGIYFAQVPVEPAAEYENTFVTTGAEPALVWADGEYGLAFTARREPDRANRARFTRLAPDGSMAGDEERVSDTDAASSVRVDENIAAAWAGGQYHVTWAVRSTVTPNSWVRHAIVDAAGDLVEHVRTGGSSERSIDIGIVASGETVGRVWNEAGPWAEREIFFRTGDDWSRMTSRDNGNADMPSLAWTGSEYVMVYRAGGNLHLIRIDTRALPIGAAVLITDGESPSLVWADGVLAMAWVRGDPGEVFFATLDTTEGLVTEVQVTETAGASRAPSLAWTGSEFGLAWQDNDLGDNQIYYARLPCNP